MINKKPIHSRKTQILDDPKTVRRFKIRKVVMQVDSKSRIGQISKITESLFLTGARGLSFSNIQIHRISCVINTTLEVPLIQCPGVQSIRIAVNDVSGENLSPYFDDVSDKINCVCVNGGRVLIHCVAGVSRSASFVLAYLMKYKEMSLKDAYRYLNSERSVVRPRDCFFRQLIDYEKKLYGSPTVAMVKVKGFDDHEIEVPDIYATEFKRMVLLEAFVKKSKKEKPA